MVYASWIPASLKVGVATKNVPPNRPFPPNQTVDTRRAQESRTWLAHKILAESMRVQWAENTRVNGHWVPTLERVQLGPQTVQRISFHHRGCPSTGTGKQISELHDEPTMVENRYLQSCAYNDLMIIFSEVLIEGGNRDVYRGYAAPVLVRLDF